MQKDTTSTRQVGSPTPRTVAKARSILNECCENVTQDARGLDIPAPLTWVGDNIGQQNGAPIIIDLMGDTGEHIYASVAATLILANRIKTSERERILTALRHCSTAGEMHPTDKLAHQAWEQEQAVGSECSAPGDQYAAALDVSKVVCLLHTLQWAGKRCEDAHDFEQFHALALELVPRLGSTLERTMTDLGQARTGLFEEACHGR